MGSMKYIVKVDTQPLFSFDETSDKKALANFKKYLEDTKDPNPLNLFDSNDILIASTNPFLNKYASIPNEEWKYLKGIEQIDIHSPTSDRQTIYFDMDGVLAKWGSGSSTSEMPSMEEIFDIKNHYFSKVKPDENAKNLFEALSDKGYDVCVISNADKDTIPDKYFWLKENFDIKDEQIFFAPLKADKADFVKGNADISVLIDDNSAVLSKWEEHGGKGIKYYNGFNKNTLLSINFVSIEKKFQQLEDFIAENDDYSDDFIEQKREALIHTLYSTTKRAIEKVEDTLERISCLSNKEKEIE